ncbi:hypothetical protein OPV22_011967 [Ensete ventricosum]|uniref:Uncharacterized protein n=1 Tax=Ensete ventricosum TaxID=4639 RepID=A0AAV8R6E5_ENSVE|nr:hypothetical protein OPV22_011967 [Ensete ventricosum]
MALISSRAMCASDRRPIAAAFWVYRLDAVFAAASLQLQPWLGRLREQRRHARPRRIGWNDRGPPASAAELVGGVLSWLTEMRGDGVLQGERSFSHPQEEAMRSEMFSSRGSEDEDDSCWYCCLEFAVGLEHGTHQPSP